MTITPSQETMLNSKLDAAHVSTRKQNGMELSYIEAWWAIAEANRIFGFDGWTRETVDMREVRPPELVKSQYGKETWRVGFIAKVRVEALGTVREGTGYGSGISADLGDAYESAVKEAESDAMKRALMTFGNPFGLALYDKSRANVGEPPRSSAALKKTDANGDDEWTRVTKVLDDELLDVSSLIGLQNVKERYREEAKRLRWPAPYLAALAERFDAKEDEIMERIEAEEAA